MLKRKPNMSKEEALRLACEENGFIYDPNGYQNGVEKSYVVFYNSGYNLMFSNTQNLIFATKEDLTSEEYLAIYKTIIQNMGDQFIEKSNSDAIVLLTLFDLSDKTKNILDEITLNRKQIDELLNKKTKAKKYVKTITAKY